jgi:hypothetical protein
MRKVIMTVVSVLVTSAVVAMANCGSCGGDKAAAGDKTGACSKVTMDCKGMSLYACATCKTVAQQAGKCSKCNADLAKMHVLACKDGSATLCACATDCKCTLKADDATKCGCGKDVVSVSVKGLKCGEACKAPAAKAE